MIISRSQSLEVILLSSFSVNFKSFDIPMILIFAFERRCSFAPERLYKKFLPSGRSLSISSSTMINMPDNWLSV